VQTPPAVWGREAQSKYTWCLCGNPSLLHKSFFVGTIPPLCFLTYGSKNLHKSSIHEICVNAGLLFVYYLKWGPCWLITSLNKSDRNAAVCFSSSKLDGKDKLSPWGKDGTCVTKKSNHNVAIENENPTTKIGCIIWKKIKIFKAIFLFYVLKTWNILAFYLYLWKLLLTKIEEIENNQN